MNTAEQALWSRIDLFQLDDPATAFPFSARLARENGWPKHYALRVIEEYKRFIFLCCLTDSGVTPSDPVDQVWHLHLTFTRSYWVDFCRNTLGQEIHHNPTKGGSKEARKFNDFYSHTRQLYLDKFAQEPPADIWQPNKIRFSDVNFQRVNRSRFWLIPKPKLPSFTSVALLGVVASGCVFVQAKGSNVIWFIVGGFCLFLLLLVTISHLASTKRNEGGSDGGGCGASGCGSTESGHAHSDAGDAGGDGGGSGCSGSGCSGCGGGD